MSDIVIKGMGMPKGCWWYDDDLSFHECKLAKVCPYHLTIGLYDNEYPDAEKSEDCPLIELPPHGRLIDADKLKTKIIRERDKKGLLSWQATKKYHFALDKIFDAPTILEASE